MHVQVYQFEYMVTLPPAPGGPAAKPRELHCVSAVAARGDVLYTLTALAPPAVWARDGPR